MNDETNNSVQVVGRRKLWFGLVAAFLAFSVDGYLGFVITWRTCFIGHGQFGALSTGGVRWLLVAITLGLFALSVIGGLMSYSHWKEVSDSRSKSQSGDEPKDVVHAESSGTAEFVAMLGVLCSTCLSVGIIWLSLPLIFIEVCVRAH